jgi:hypothetical protein
LGNDFGPFLAQGGSFAEGGTIVGSRLAHAKNGTFVAAVRKPPHPANRSPRGIFKSFHLTMYKKTYLNSCLPKHLPPVHNHLPPVKKNRVPGIHSSLCALLLLGLAQISTAQNTTWTGAVDDDWNTPENWSDGVPVIAAGATATIAADGANVTMSAPGVSRALLVAGNGAIAPVLNITQNLTNNLSRVRVGGDSDVAGGCGGTINHTAGTLLIGGGAGNRDLHIAVKMTETTDTAGGTVGSSGTYNFGGESSDSPTLDVLGSIVVGGRPGESGVLSLSGHGTLEQGGGDANGHVIINNANGEGTLNVTGGNLNINLANNLVFGKFGAGLSILNATIDSTGISTITVGGDVSFGGNNLKRTQFNLFLDGVTPAVGSTYTIIRAGGNFTTSEGANSPNHFGNVADGDILTVNGINFEARYNSDANGSTFDLTVVP